MSAPDLLALLIVVLITGYEGWALGNPAAGDTWSERVQAFRDSWPGRILVGGGTFWLAYHWGLDRVAGMSWVDPVAATLGAVATMIAGPVQRAPGRGVK